MATKYFKKELCTNKFFLNNAPVPFECQPSNTGVIALDTDKDAALIAGLEDAIKKRRGGIGEIDAETFDAIKKNTNGKTSVAFSPKERLKVLPQQNKTKQSQPKSAGVNGARQSNQNPSGRKTEGDEPFAPARGRVINDADKKTGNQ